MNSAKQPILCVEDDEDGLELLTYVFESQNFDVTACGTLEECLSKVRENVFAAIILDNRFGSRSSVEVCDEIRTYNPDTPIIFYSGETREEERKKAIEACADAYLLKPNDFSKLTETVTRLIEESYST
jgi:DNA-binding response OmpR family regulator